MLLDNAQWAYEAASLARCGGMICNLAVNEWDLEESPDSRANLLFWTSTVSESLGELKEVGDCTVQSKNSASAKTGFLVASGKSKSRVVLRMHCDYTCIVLDTEAFCVQTTFTSKTSVGII